MLQNTKIQNTKKYAHGDLSFQMDSIKFSTNPLWLFSAAVLLFLVKPGSLTVNLEPGLEWDPCRIDFSKQERRHPLFLGTAGDRAQRSHADHAHAGTRGVDQHDIDEGLHPFAHKKILLFRIAYMYRKKC
jgi:hypothetical protein